MSHVQGCFEVLIQIVLEFLKSNKTKFELYGKIQVPQKTTPFMVFVLYLIIKVIEEVCLGIWKMLN